MKTYIIWLSQLLWSMSELAILGKRAVLVLHEVLAKLSLIFLFQRVKLTLISIEIFVIWLLSQLSNDFAWWIVKISFSLLIVRSFLLVFIFQIGIFVRNSLGRIGIFFQDHFPKFFHFQFEGFLNLTDFELEFEDLKKIFFEKLQHFRLPLCFIIFKTRGSESLLCSKLFLNFKLSFFKIA